MPMLIMTEFALAIVDDMIGRVVMLVDSLLSDRLTNESSVNLMEHAKTLDLEDFEDAEFQDQLHRARRQTTGRATLMTQMFGQLQDIVTGLGFPAGLTASAPCRTALFLAARLPWSLAAALSN